MAKLVNLSETASIRAVLQHLKESKLRQLLDDFEKYLKQDPDDNAEEDPERDFYMKLFEVPYSDVSAFRQVYEAHLPYSTKHGVKGAEFDTVYVILDDAGAKWNQYSFGNLLSGSETNESRLKRTKNLFYVCCSRSKDRLAVVHLGNAQQGKNAITSLFGPENCAF
jgi:DNA helicase-2/ATP-dependent DNA helicase PcrA